jgi:hypothetical protein
LQACLENEKASWPAFSQWHEETREEGSQLLVCTIPLTRH